MIPIRTLISWALATLTVGLALGPHQEPATDDSAPSLRERVPITPDPALQARLEQLSQSRTAGDFYRAAAAVFDQVAAAGDESEDKAFVRQVLFHAAYGPGSDAERLELLSMLLRLELMRTINVTRGGVVWAAVPYLDDEDGRLRNAAEVLIGQMDVYRPDYQHDDGFEEIEAYLGTPPRVEDPPRQLVKGMYQARPHAAVRAMARIYLNPAPGPDKDAEIRATSEQSELTAAVRHIEQHLSVSSGFDQGALEPETAAIFQKLAQDEHWWVRLYAAQLMKRYPAFRDAATMRRLSDDPNSLVRQISAEAAEPARRERGKLPPKQRDRR